MLIIYLQMDDLKRKELKDFALEKKLTFFNFVNQVLRIRRKWYKTYDFSDIELTLSLDLTQEENTNMRILRVK